MKEKDQVVRKKLKCPVHHHSGGQVENFDFVCVK